MPPKDQEQETSMRDDFETAISNVENNDEGAITTETQAAADEHDTPEGLNNDGQETPETEAEAKIEAEASEILDKEPDSEERIADEGADTQSSADADGDDGDGKAAGLAGKPPASWNATAREGWKDLPEPMRAHITKREHEIDKALNDGAQHRKTGKSFQAIADQYAQVIAAEGAPDALTGVEELVKTVSTLRMGSQEQKAQKIAGFIKHYGIDITMLDGILTGDINGTPAVDANDPVTQMLDARLKPMDDMLARMNEQQQAKQFQTNQNAINEVATFKQAHEFYSDVQHDMADMVEQAEKRGVTMPLQEAYDKACAINPEISKIVSKRLNDAVLMGDKETIEKKRYAASSISGKQGGNPAADQDLSMRDTITSLYDSQVG